MIRKTNSQIISALRSQVDVGERAGNTPLHVVILSSGMTEARDPPPGYVKCTRLLIDSGAPVNAENNLGRRRVETTVFCTGEIECGPLNPEP